MLRRNEAVPTHKDAHSLDEILLERSRHGAEMSCAPADATTIVARDSTGTFMRETDRTQRSRPSKMDPTYDDLISLTAHQVDLLHPNTSGFPVWNLNSSRLLAASHLVLET